MMLASDTLRRRALLALAAAASVWAAVDAAYAQSLREMRARDAEERALQREAAYTGSVCGGSLSASIDWSSVSDWPEDESLTDACDGALGALEAICRESDGERGGDISKFVCGGDGSGASLYGDTLYYGADPGVSGFSDTRDVLESEL